MRGVCIGKQGLVEMFLYNLRTKIDELVFFIYFYNLNSKSLSNDFI